MSGVNECVVREYFETLGFLVSQPRKYVVPGRQKQVEEELDLIVSNPLCTRHAVPETLLWTRDDLQRISRAIIGVRGWHTERFYVSTFEQTPEILRFAEADSLRYAESLMGPGPMAKILCLPRLPASGSLKDKTIHVLKERGIDGVVSFRTMLAELVSQVDVKKNYEKSDMLQIIRLLKNYDLIKDRQLDLFDQRRPR